MNVVRSGSRRLAVTAAVAVALVITVVGLFTSTGNAGDTRISDEEFVRVETYAESTKAAGIDVLYGELDQRLEEWSATARIESMADPQLADVIDLLTDAMPGMMDDAGNGAFELHELAARRNLACESLSLEHPYRGEYC